MPDPALTDSDLAKDERKRAGETLVLTLAPLFERLRLELEREDLRAALVTARSLVTDLARLGCLVTTKSPPSMPAIPPLPGSPDALALQAFRRGASRAFERFARRLDQLEAGPWRSRAVLATDRAVVRQRLRHGLVLGLAALVAGIWFWTQQARIHAQKTLVDQAKAQTALNALKFLSMTAWRAQNASGQPLSALVRDMSADCAGIDVNASLPNSPCREDWAHNREVLFTRFIPPPGETRHAPAEIYYDPWGGPYLVLASPGVVPRIVSAGPTGRLGDPGNLGVDVPYWPVEKDAPNDAQTNPEEKKQ